MKRWLFAMCLSVLASPAWAGWLGFGLVENPAPGQDPGILITGARPVGHIQVVVKAGGQSWKFERRGVPAKETMRFEWDRDDGVTEAVVQVLCEFADGTEEEYELPVQWSFGGGLTVDLSRASADITKRVLLVDVTAPVTHAEVIAYGAHKAILDSTDVPINAGPGQIEVPWVGRPADVVLLDVKVHGERSWASFTYSPWFLNIPHDDVLFATNSDVIEPDQEPKLADTLKRLQEVLTQYGDVVPVKLYIAGCTDTVGSEQHNLDLSRRRARSIATWLRSHGYREPVFFHGFGEGLLARPTPDETEHADNRRALYIVGVNPPPAGSGIPSVPWSPL